MYLFKKIFLASLALPMLLSGQNIEEILLENLSVEDIKNQVLGNDLDLESETPLVIEESLQNPNFITNERMENPFEATTSEAEGLTAKKFGYDFFFRIPTSTTVIGDLPLPNDYRISLNDSLKVILTGSKEQIFSMQVNLDGTVFFPELGAISVAGETFEDVKRKLNNLVTQSYIGVNLDLSIQNLSAKKITIVGAVNFPGTYLVNPFSTITSSLAYSGGIDEIGSLRDIVLIKPNGEKFKFDMYEFLIKGNREGDLTIDSGDTILVNPAEKFVEVIGSVKRPAIYEIKDGEAISDLLDFALGPNQTTNIKKIKISKLNSLDGSIININTNDLKTMLSDVIAIEFFDFESLERGDIEIQGAIREPGAYSLEKLADLETLIRELEFVDVFPWLAVLEQFDPDSLITQIKLFSLKDPRTFLDTPLFPSAKVRFLGYDDLDTNLLGISDAAKDLVSEFALRINHKGMTYSVPVTGRYSVVEVVEFLGLDLESVESKATYLSPIEGISETVDFQLMEYDSKRFNTISFRSKRDNLISINVSGDVDYPGSYTLDSEATLADLYGLIGFKKTADLDSIILKRESVRKRELEIINEAKENLNEILLLSSTKDQMTDPAIVQALASQVNPENLGRVAGNFNPNNKNAAQTLLVSNDEIVIPKISNTINVFGEVYNPISFFSSDELPPAELLNIAGGLKDSADRSNIYIIRSDGTVKIVSRNVFSGRSLVGPGDSLVVPRKVQVEGALAKTIIPFTELLSNLAFSASALESLSNN